MIEAYMYLRKSRDDVEKEKEGIDTLSSHKKILFDYAKNNNISIVSIKEEIISGGYLFNRPKMMELLKEIENGLVKAVLCMDIDRLGRSGMKEQGIILETFKAYNVSIITPTKTYNLNDENDELQTEVQAFTARLELNMIKKRLKRGKLRALSEGYYISGTPPFGYKIKRIRGGNTLEIVEKNAETIRFIFDLYTKKNYGAIKICKILKSLGIPNANGNTEWSYTTIKKIIHNIVYTGKVTDKRRIYKNTENGITTKLNPNYLIYDGKHEAIIDEEVFNEAQKIASERYNIPNKDKFKTTNPLSGLIKCSCGYAMTLRHSGKACWLRCSKDCGVASTNIVRVEKKLFEYLKIYLYNIDVKIDLGKTEKNTEQEMLTLQLKQIQNSIKKKLNQQTRLYELLEQNVYDTDTFLLRSNALKDELEFLNNKELSLQKQLKDCNKRFENKNVFIPKLKNIIENYESLEFADQKNKLLKSIISKITYSKERGAEPDDFTLNVEFKV